MATTAKGPTKKKKQFRTWKCARDMLLPYMESLQEKIVSAIDWLERKMDVSCEACVRAHIDENRSYQKFTHDLTLTSIFSSPWISHCPSKFGTFGSMCGNIRRKLTSSVSWWTVAVVIRCVRIKCCRRRVVVSIECSRRDTRTHHVHTHKRQRHDIHRLPDSFS